MRRSRDSSGAIQSGPAMRLFANADDVGVFVHSNSRLSVSPAWLIPLFTPNSHPAAHPCAAAVPLGHRRIARTSAARPQKEAVETVTESRRRPAGRATWE